MLIYNKTIFSFIKKTEGFLKEILEREVKTNTLRSRFIFNNYYYPISIVVFKDSSKIGYFDQGTYQIGLNECLVYQSRDHVIKDIIRHELAHYLTFIKHPNAAPHGFEFKETCSKYNWNKEISSGQMDLESYKEDKVANLENEKVLNKVKKLFALSSSANTHEAELATLKANSLLMKHNLKMSGENHDDEDLFIIRILKSKRRNSKLSAIYDILKHFYVNPILRYTKDGVYLEICGSALNIELSEYIASFLDQKLDELWLDLKSKNPALKGARAKNSFFLGIAKGYNDKHQNMESKLNDSEKTSLIKINEELNQSVKRIYKRLSSTSSSAGGDSSAFNSGKKAGLNLNINKAIKSKNKQTYLIGN